MSSPFDMITHSPIMQLANLARAGQNPMGLIQQLSGQNAPIMQGLNLIQGQKRSTAPNDGAEPRQRARHRPEPAGKRPEPDAAPVKHPSKRNASQFCGLDPKKPLLFGFAHRIRRWDSLRKTERSFVMDDFATGYTGWVRTAGNNNGGFFGNEGLWAVINPRHHLRLGQTTARAKRW